MFHAVSVYDEVIAGSSDGLTLEVDGADTSPRVRQPAYRAAHALAQHAGVPADVALQIRKTIPIAGGMAGERRCRGDLGGLRCVVGLRLNRVDLLEVAAGLGSDVPFALVGGTAIGLGRGEQITPALTRGTFHWVLGVADRGLSTPAVYAEVDRMRAGRRVPPPQVSADVMSALRAGDPAALGRALSNDLQHAACNLRHQLRLTLDVGEEYGALGAIVSGAGPTCAFWGVMPSTGSTSPSDCPLRGCAARSARHGARVRGPRARRRVRSGHGSRESNGATKRPEQRGEHVFVAASDNGARICRSRLQKVGHRIIDPAPAGRGQPNLDAAAVGGSGAGPPVDATRGDRCGWSWCRCSRASR